MQFICRYYTILYKGPKHPPIMVCTSHRAVSYVKQNSVCIYQVFYSLVITTTFFFTLFFSFLLVPNPFFSVLNIFLFFLFLSQCSITFSILSIFLGSLNCYVEIIFLSYLILSSKSSYFTSREKLYLNHYSTPHFLSGPLSTFLVPKFLLNKMVL